VKDLEVGIAEDDLLHDHGFVFDTCAVSPLTTSFVMYCCAFCSEHLEYRAAIAML
jgi:hypothetical protein